MPESPTRADQGRTAPGRARIVVMRCPACRRTRLADSHKTDPPGTRVVVYPCSRSCRMESWDGDPVYLDRAGRVIVELGA